MSYILNWSNPALPGKSAITVGVASTVTSAALTLTGKGAANYGAVQQENLLHLLENFASPTAPLGATIGQMWYDSNTQSLKVLKDIPDKWLPLAGLQITDIGTPPTQPFTQGDIWFEKSANAGFLYVYTGSGRFPATPLDTNSMRAAGIYPPVSTTLGITRNVGNLSVPNPGNPGECYISGFVGAVLSDVPGTIMANGISTVVPQGILGTRFKIDHAYIMWDPTHELLSTIGASVAFYVVRPTGLGTWEYDNNTSWVAFTPSTTQQVIGTISVLSNDVSGAGAAAAGQGVGSAEIWQAAIPLTSFRAPIAAAADGLGGWTQVFPTVEYHGSRFEYDALLEQVLSFIGAAEAWGGNDAARGLGLTDLDALDAHLVAVGYRPLAVYDPLIGPAAEPAAVKVEPSSQDWDKLLAAARWALNRLDVPQALIEGISPFPFTVDGRQPPSELLALHTSNIRYPTRERRSNRRFGSMTSLGRYAETMNALQSAKANRYTLAGIMGTNSTVPSFRPTVSTTLHAANYFTNVTPGGLMMPMRFNFETQWDLNRFIHSGSAVDILLGYALPASPSAADYAMASFANTYWRFRLTADSVYCFNYASQLVLAITPTNKGMKDCNDVVVTQLASFTRGGVIAHVDGILSLGGGALPSYIELRIVVTPTGALTGNVSVNHYVTHDAETFGNANELFFPLPYSYIPVTDYTGAYPTPVTNGNIAVMPPASPVPAPVAPVSINIAQQPAGQVVSAGSIASFSVLASGPTSLTYQWQTSTDGVSYGDIAGATSSSYSFTTVLADSGKVYRVKVTDASAAINFVLSTSAGLQVNAVVVATPVTTYHATSLVNPTATAGVNLGAPSGLNVAVSLMGQNAYPNPGYTPSVASYSASVVSGSLPPGVSLFDGGSGSYFYQGTPTTAGTYTFGLRRVGVGTVGDTYDYTSIITFTVGVMPAHVVDGTHVSVSQGVSINSGSGIQLFTLAGGTAPTFVSITSISNLPNGTAITMTGGVPVLSGIPQQPLGVFAVTAQISFMDNGVTSTQWVTSNVTVY